MLILFKNL